MAEKHQTVVYLADRKMAPGSIIERAFKEHGTALRRFLQARLALQEDREDLIQELFLKLSGIDNLAERLSEQSGSTRCYLLAIATNLIVDRQRRASARREDQQHSYNDELAPSENFAPEAIAATQQQVDTTVKLLQRMNPKYRRAFVLNRFKYKSYREISQEMGVSETTVERYIASALGILRRGIR